MLTLAHCGDYLTRVHEIGAARSIGAQKQRGSDGPHRSLSRRGEGFDQSVTGWRKSNGLSGVLCCRGAAFIHTHEYLGERFCSYPRTADADPRRHFAR
jgi:hypothetical protein